ncbi:hypothetical protein K4F52_001479 [Lecanicillium sp. MT-2017a]|nr:hypothetical protein K4F52_001479 [Lecanicillium sp. MT-2017a]
MATREHRNVLTLIADDLGLMLGCYGLAAVKTPNIDKLAAGGVRFTNAFASTASCSGSRSTIYTGLHTHQNGQYGLSHGWNHFQTHDHIETVPQVFNSLGYQTGIIGKVHVGPREVYPWEWYLPSQSRDVSKVADEVGRFLVGAKETSRPFHLTVGFCDPHRDASREGFGNAEPDVLNIPVPEYQQEDVEIPPFLPDVAGLRVELVEYYKSISRMDIGVGLIMQELEKHGLLQNTLVVFMSDNGSPFINSKTTLYDAGVRLPLIVRHPCDQDVAGTVNPNMISFLDVLPTCIDWTGQNQEVGMRTESTESSPRRLGRSFLGILGESQMLPDAQWQQHVFGSHTFHEVQNYWPTRFMRTDRYKYHRNVAWQLNFPFATDIYGSLSWEDIRNNVTAEDGASFPRIMLGRRQLTSYLQRGPEELYDIVDDPDEIHNLATEPRHNATLVKMRTAVEEWQYATDDVWLFKDGVSVITSQGYQRLGLKMRDRFDFDPTRAGLGAGPFWKPGMPKSASKITTQQG